MACGRFRRRGEHDDHLCVECAHGVTGSCPVVDKCLNTHNEESSGCYWTLKQPTKKSVTIHNLTEDQVSLLLDHVEGYDLLEGSIDVEDTLQP